MITLFCQSGEISRIEGLNPEDFVVFFNGNIFAVPANWIFSYWTNCKTVPENGNLESIAPVIYYSFGDDFLHSIT